MRPRVVVIALGVALAAGGGISDPKASAQDAAAAASILQQRQALMKKQGADMGAVHAYLDGKADLVKATAAAVDLTQTMSKIPDVFPPGTGGTSPDGKYATKAAIWTDWNNFLAVRNAAGRRADALAAAVKGGDKAAVQTAFADLGKNGCGACHGKFREEIKK